MTCSETYYPQWSSRGIRGVKCERPAKKMLWSRMSNTTRPVCGVHARKYRGADQSYKFADLPS